MNPEIETLKKAMREATVTGVGQYINEGQHYLEVVLVKCQRTPMDGIVKESYIAECKVLASSNATHEVGSTRSYIENVKNQGWLGRFKGFLAAASGFDPSLPLSPAQQEYLSDAIAALRYDEYRVTKGWTENWLKGRFITCEGFADKSQKGTPITNKKWRPAGPPAAAT